jgi:hypothetical protein
MRSAAYIVPIAAFIAIAAGCRPHTFVVRPPGPPTSVDPETEECLERDARSLLESHVDDIEACTRHLGCRTDHIRTVTVMMGCNGTVGAFYVLSHADLEDFNECMVERGSSWDYSVLCPSKESECSWTFDVEIECRLQ